MDLQQHTPDLIEHISSALYKNIKDGYYLSSDINNKLNPSAVLFLLGPHCGENGNESEPCLILNKRSGRVKQPGDLCCPGGSVAPRVDSFFAKLLVLQSFPIARWPYWSGWRNQNPSEARQLALFFATCLRESFEEMRLNPFGVKFLGPLPPQRLEMFKRIIFPMAGWVSRQKKFVPNWEVEKVVYIPLRNLLTPDNYACYHLQFPAHLNRGTQDLPCFLYKNQGQSELLWGATYRIVTMFLSLIFKFTPPDMGSLPKIPGILEGNYLTGNSE
ncbi:MAG: CoA pyrophosphatase [Desulfobacterales bacterium]|nr:CoA pyrophosphatase [Desulfobacterales bacterium]